MRPEGSEAPKAPRQPRRENTENVVNVNHKVNVQTHVLKVSTHKQKTANG
jgi:hypothetical protein